MQAKNKNPTSSLPLSTATCILSYLQRKNFKEATLAQEKTLQLFELSGDYYFPKLVRKLDETAEAAFFGKPEAELHMTAIVHFLDEAIAEEQQMAECAEHLSEMLLGKPTDNTK